MRLARQQLAAIALVIFLATIEARSGAGAKPSATTRANESRSPRSTPTGRELSGLGVVTPSGERWVAPHHIVRLVADPDHRPLLDLFWDPADRREVTVYRFPPRDLTMMIRRECRPSPAYTPPRLELVRDLTDD